MEEFPGFVARLSVRGQMFPETEIDSVLIEAGQRSGWYRRSIVHVPLPMPRRVYVKRPDENSLFILHQMGMPMAEINNMIAADLECVNQLSLHERILSGHSGFENGTILAFSGLVEAFDEMVTAVDPKERLRRLYPWRLTKKIRCVSRALRSSSIARFPKDVRGLIIKTMVRVFYEREAAEAGEMIRLVME